MRIVGLTGGIASGKSIVSSFLKEEGQIVIDCDALAHIVTQKGRWGWQRIVHAFGPGILNSEGEVDRDKLGHIVFRDRAERIKLNRATHMPVAVELIKQILWHWTLCTQMLWVDMPLLFETGAYKWMSRNVVVLVDKETQVDRLKARDQITTEAALFKIEAQMPTESKISRADYIIDNRGSLEDTRGQVSSLAQKLKSDSSRYLSVILSPAGLCVVAVFLVAIGSDLKSNQSQSPNIKGPVFV